MHDTNRLVVNRTRRAVVAALLVLGCAPATTLAAHAERAVFGTLPDGAPIESVLLSNGHGVSARIITLGAALQSLIAPDRNGRPGDIVLGYSTAQEYVEKPRFFGATAGRYANRIAKGQFALDGHTYTLVTNDRGNHLHGGKRGFDKVNWTIDSVSSGAAAAVVLSYVSADGEEGYPGTLHVTATYSLDEHNQLRLQYRATTDKPTVVNLTNHSYFNLGGENAVGSALEQLLTLHAASFTVPDATGIPTGEIRSVAGTDFDFRQPTPLGAHIRDSREPLLTFARGYDINFVVDGSPGTLRLAARAEDPVSGRVLELLVTAPGVQLYTANGFDGTTLGKAGRLYRQSDAFCLEPQAFPDSPNHPAFPSARLDPGSTYENTIVYRLSTRGR